MPHIVVEYSRGLSNVRAMLAEMHAALGAEDSVDPDRIKSRAIPLDDVIVGTQGNDAAMIHIAVKLMPRPADVAKRMARTMQAIARKHAAAKDCAITAEIVTLNPETYCP